MNWEFEAAPNVIILLLPPPAPVARNLHLVLFSFSFLSLFDYFSLFPICLSQTSLFLEPSGFSEEGRVGNVASREVEGKVWSITIKTRKLRVKKKKETKANAKISDQTPMCGRKQAPQPWVMP